MANYTDEPIGQSGTGPGNIGSSMPAVVISAASQLANTALQNKYNKEAAERANEMNKENQQWLLDQNKALQAEQREYDSPAAQMKRYLEAGLNPHLIYGNGGSAGSAFAIDAGNLPPAQVANRIAGIPDVGQMFLAAQTQSIQNQLARARTNQVQIDSGLKAIMTDIAKTNPMLSPEVSTAVAQSMLRTAELKSAEAWYMKHGWIDRDKDKSEVLYVAKINAEIEAMAQRIGLNNADIQIRNKILESKEFENAVKEIQARWLKDGDITPEHIRQGMMLLLQKMLGN